MLKFVHLFEWLSFPPLCEDLPGKQCSLWVSVFCVVLSFIPIGLHSKVSLWLLWLCLECFGIMYTMSGYEEPPLSVSLTRESPSGSSDRCSVGSGVSGVNLLLLL